MILNYIENDEVQVQAQSLPQTQAPVEAQAQINEIKEPGKFTGNQIEIDLMEDLKHFEDIKARMLDITQNIKQITQENNEWNVINSLKEYRGNMKK